MLVWSKQVGLDQTMELWIKEVKHDSLKKYIGLHSYTLSYCEGIYSHDILYIIYSTNLSEIHGTHISQYLIIPLFI